MRTEDLIFLAIFFWGMFVVARVFIYASKIDVKLKKKLWPVIIVGLGMTVLATAMMFNVPGTLYYFLVPITLMIVFINMRGFYFCEKCGRMLAHRNPFQPPERCFNCKARL